MFMRGLPMHEHRMSDIEGVYEDLEADVSLEEFREAVEEKVEQMGGLADEETAAMLIAHEVGESEVGGIADIEPGMEEAKFVAKVLSIGEVRTFDRDGEDEDGRVVNVEVADETGSVRAAFWDEHAEAAIEELEEGQVLRVKGRPKEGFSGVEISVDQVEPDPDTEIDEVQVSDTHTVESLSLGLSNVNLVGLVLDTGTVRTFDRDDGSEGKVSNLVLGDSTGRVRVTLWDEQAELATEFDPGVTAEVVDGYVKERDGSLELHVGNRGAVEEVDEDIEYVPESTPIEDIEIGQTVDLAGVVRSADPKRTFDRDDGSEGQVRNIRVQDATGDIRVAMWGEKPISISDPATRSPSVTSRSRTVGRTISRLLRAGSRRLRSSSPRLTRPRAETTTPVLAATTQGCPRSLAILPIPATKPTIRRPLILMASPTLLPAMTTPLLTARKPSSPASSCRLGTRSFSMTAKRR